MLKPGNVPKEAVEAARKIIRLPDEWIDDLIAAALSAWPGMLTERRARCDAVVLPYNLDADLPQETHND